MNLNSHNIFLSCHWIMVNYCDLFLSEVPAPPALDTLAEEVVK